MGTLKDRILDCPTPYLAAIVLVVGVSIFLALIELAEHISLP